MSNQILKVQIIQPGLSETEPVAILGIFPCEEENIKHLLNVFISSNYDSTIGFEKYVKSTIVDYVNSYAVLAIKDEEEIMTIVLRKTDDTNSKNIR